MREINVTYVNAAQDIYIEADELEGSYIIKWLADHQYAHCNYDKGTNLLHISLGARSTAGLALWENLERQAGFDAVLGLLEQNVNENMCNVTMIEEDGYEKFNVIFNEETSSLVDLNSLTVWVDPATKLIHKYTGRLYEDEDLTLSFTYDVPSVNDVYGVGIPEDASSPGLPDTFMEGFLHDKI